MLWDLHHQLIISIWKLQMCMIHRSQACNLSCSLLWEWLFRLLASRTFSLPEHKDKCLLAFLLFRVWSYIQRKWVIQWEEQVHSNNKSNLLHSRKPKTRHKVSHPCYYRRTLRVKITTKEWNDIILSIRREGLVCLSFFGFLYTALETPRVMVCKYATDWWGYRNWQVGLVS